MRCNASGSVPPERLALAEVPAPVPAPNEVLVGLRCCAVSYFDTLFIQGPYQIKPLLPFIPGAEVAGVVGEVGDDAADRFRPGDRLIALTWTGGLAERVCVGMDELVRLPETIGFDAGAAMVMAYGTAALALDSEARLRAGETVLVLGGGGVPKPPGAAGVGPMSVSIGATSPAATRRRARRGTPN